MFDVDLQQADAQVVAWECDDDELKAIFRDPDLDLHDENCKAIFGKLTKNGRQMAKAGVHATNYGSSPRTMARHLGITVAMAEAFQRKWFSAHPNIKDWHRRIESQLQTTRVVSNKFGFRIRYFGRVEQLLPEALAWIPQSTVGRIINEGLNNLDELPEVTPLIQVHDSIVGQFPNSFYPHRYKIRDALTVPVPYDDPLIIGVDMDASRNSWGACKRVEWEGGLFCPH
jgi:hypothetical protein